MSNAAVDRLQRLQAAANGDCPFLALPAQTEACQLIEAIDKLVEYRKKVLERIDADGLHTERRKWKASNVLSACAGVGVLFAPVGLVASAALAAGSIAISVKCAKLDKRCREVMAADSELEKAYSDLVAKFEARFVQIAVPTVQELTPMALGGGAGYVAAIAAASNHVDEASTAVVAVGTAAAGVVAAAPSEFFNTVRALDDVASSVQHVRTGAEHYGLRAALDGLRAARLAAALAAAFG